MNRAENLRNDAIDRSNAPKPKRERPAIAKLNDAIAEALASDGPAPVFHCLSKGLQATWEARPAPKGARCDIALREQVFAPKSGGGE